jgi:integrase
MASIAWDGKDGDMARIVFRDAAGKQQSLRLGRCAKRTAQNALTGFERVLESHRVGSTIHPDGVKWLERLDDRLHGRVVRLGLAEPRKGVASVTVAELLERFAGTAAVKDSTRAAYKQTTDSLAAFLGAASPLHAVTTERADAWRNAIAEQGSGCESQHRPSRRLAAATVAKRVHVARAIFKKAVRWRLIAANPFEEVRAGSQSNPERSHYVSREAIGAILAACSDAEWRAIVALSRFAGLRCPSEVGALRWGDVNWEKGRLTARSPKTAHHEGHAVRVVPIAPELRPILQDLFDGAEEGAEAVIPRLRDPRTNLRTHFHRIIARAGLKPWPRLFHNLRASCATDWVETFPNHVVAGWLGHSPMIAATHYLQTRDAHFDLAAGLREGAGTVAVKATTNPAAIPATHALRSTRSRREQKEETPRKPAALARCAIGCDPMESWKMGDTGFEPVTPRV